MKLRLDLLEHLTDEDIMEEVLANNHRYKPEPLLSKTGVGSLSSASTRSVRKRWRAARPESRGLCGDRARVGRAPGPRVLPAGDAGVPQELPSRAPFLFFNGNTFADV